MSDKTPNPKLLKFVRKVTDRAAGKIKGITVEDPEYWGFACIFEDELDKEMSENSLDLLLQMKVRKKYPYSEINYPRGRAPEFVTVQRCRRPLTASRL